MPLLPGSDISQWELRISLPLGLCSIAISKREKEISLIVHMVYLNIFAP